MKIKRKMYVLLIVLVAALTFSVLTACDPKPKEQELVAGPEAGVYYYDDEGIEYQIALAAGNRFTFWVMGENLSGEYTLTGTSLVFDFAGDKADLNATLDGEVLTLNYSGSQMRFLKKLTYTVTFDSAGGSAVAAATVVNGKTVSRPADPARDGYTFIGWYTDNTHTHPFLFDTDIVTSNVTLYAYWGESVLGQAEFTVDFELGYEQAPAMASAKTVGGKLYNVATPVRTGYTFGGWWISMYDDAEMLTARYTDDMVFCENTTLFAQWTANASAGLIAPEVSVTTEGMSRNVAAGVSYRLKVEGPSGFTAIDKASDAAVEAIDFASAPAGDYVITVTATQGSESVSTVRYFKNKALASVSFFSVVEPSALVFGGVENAQRYFITIECGDEQHRHERFALGESTFYNFANCPMRDGGIAFTITAEAEGFASSVSKTFVYERKLDKIDQNAFVFDEATEILTWQAVENAQGYKVEILCGNSNHVHEEYIGNVTSLCIKGCAPRAEGVVVKIIPVTKNYISPEATEFVYMKTRLATPENIRVEDELLTWDSLGEGVSYQVRVGSSQPVIVTENSFSLADAVATAAPGTDFSVTVRARMDGNDSLWSDAADMRYYAMYGTLEYSQGVVYWRPVIGATGYQIRYNGDVSTQTNIAAGENSYEVELPFSGRNIIEVRFVDGEYVGAWATLNVTAFKITFDSRGGSSVNPVNKVYGDRMPAFEQPVRAGYEFAGWYNAIGGAEGNGALYADEFFAETGDIVLYAYWKSTSFIVTYNYYGGIAPEGSNGNARLIYGEHYTLEVPVASDATLVFGGWYQEPGGQGFRYTDELGRSLSVWNIANNDTTVYAYWIEALSFRESTGGAYAVLKGPEINKVRNLLIPATYNGMPVSYIDSGAFSSCSTLVTVEIPDTIVQVGATGATPFNECSNLEEINVYHVEGNNIITYSSADGILIFDDEVTGERYVTCVPLAKKGSVRIPDGVTEIPIRAFAGCRLSSITIPASVTAIRMRAFTSCENLSEVIFEEGANELIIESSAFANCGSLINITLPARMGELEIGNESSGTVYGVDLFNGSIYLENIFVEEGNKYYSSVDGVLCDAAGTSIIHFPNGRRGEYVVDGRITSIGDYAFSGQRLSSVVFHSGIASIGTNAFYGCYSLESITFGGGLLPAELTIGENAFSFPYQNDALTQVIFEAGSNVVEIAKGAFANNVGLKAVEIPNTVKKIRESAFANCALLKDVTLVSGGESLVIGNYAFSGCVSLATFTLSDSVTELSMNVFDGCSNLQGVYVDEGNEYFADDDGVLYDAAKTIILFYSLGRDGNVVLPETIEIIGAGVFENNMKITEITIPASVKEIQEDAFNMCLYLADIIFETSEDEDADLTIGDRAFAYCASVSQLNLPSYVTAIGDEAFYKAALLTTINFSEGLVEIGASAFADTALKQAVLPDTLTTLGASAFAGCVSLTTLELSSALENIGSKAFFDCILLAQVTIPEGVSGIGANAFENCALISEITIPNTVTTIGEAAFLNCSGLETVIFAGGGEQPLTIAGTATRNTTGVFIGCSSLSTVVLPARLTALGRYAFYNLTNLTSVTFEKDDGDNPMSNLVTIDNYAFSGSGITEFYISNTVATIGDYAFQNTYSLVSLVFEPDDENAAATLKIGTSSGYVFVNSALTSLNLPARTEFVASTDGIHKAMFGNSANLTSIEISEDNAKYKSENGVLYTKDGKQLVYFPAGRTEISDDQPLAGTVEFIGAYAFHYSRLTHITLAEGVTRIGDYAFYCANLQSVFIPASLTTLGLSALRDCPELSSVEFAEGCLLSSIGNYTFTGSALATIDLSNTSVTTLGNTAAVFGSSLTSITLPDKLDRIGAEAFKGTSLVSISIPASVTSIGKNAFFQVKTLTSVVFQPYVGEGVAPALVLEDNRSSNMPTDNQGVFAQTGLTTIEIPARMTSIGARAFEQIPTLTSVTFEDAANGKLTDIKAGAFRGTGLTEFVVPETVVALGEEYVHSSNKAHTATYVQTMRKYGVFLDCTALTSLTLSSRMTQFWWSNVVGCTSLEEILVADGSENFTSVDGVLFNSDGTRLICYPTGKAGESYTVPEGTLNIETRAFAEAVNLRTVNISKTVTYLGYGVFQKSMVTDVIFEDGGTEDITFDATAPGGSTSSNYNATMFGWSALERVHLPARLNGMPNFFFEGCKALTSVEFEENSKLQEIGNAAFRYCSALETFVMPDSVTTLVGTTGLFLDCTSLNNITLSANLKTIGQYMFKNCPVETVEIPASVETIAQYAFQNSGIKSIVIPATLTKFGNTGLNEFLNCTRLERVEIYAPIGNNLTYLNTSYFSGCTSLKEVILPANIIELGNTAFKDCISLESIDLSNIKEIGNNTFEGCTSLTSVDLRSVNMIGNYAFKGCTALTEVYIPDSVVSMGTSVFLDCDNLETLTVSEGNSAYRLGSAGELLDYDGTQILYVPASATGEYVIEQGMTAGDYAFAGTGVTKVVIPSSMTVIPQGMFANCVDLKEVELHDGVTEIKAEAFMGSGIESIYIGKNVTTIGNNAFKDCAVLAQITFGENGSSVLSMGNSAFENCVSLVNVELPRRVRAPQKVTTDRNGNVTITTQASALGTRCFAGCTGLEALTFAESGAEWMTEALTIGQYAFYGCTALTSITLPEYSRSGSSTAYYAIGAHAFDGCTELVSFEREGRDPASGYRGAYYDIGGYAFYGCSGLKTVVIPSNCYFDGAFIFSGTAIEEITLYLNGAFGSPKSMFENCEQLVSVTIVHTALIATTIYDRMFANCTALESVTVVNGRNGISAINAGAFLNCSSLTELNLPFGLRTIGANAFEGCTSLDFVLKASVTTIGANAFKGWTYEQTITSEIASDEIPSGWSSEWNEGCGASIVWATRNAGN